MKHLSLFSGIGGLDLAAEWAGFETVAFVERDPYCQRVLAKRWPGVPIFSDVRGVTADALRGRGGRPLAEREGAGAGLEGNACGDGEAFELPGIVSGGFPCQPHSVAGKRQASADDRDLWPEVARVLREIRPRWFVGENVRGLLHSESGRFFGSILGDLADLGYRVGWGVWGASDVGALHQRERVFIVAYSEDQRHERAGAARDGRDRPSDGGQDVAYAGGARSAARLSGSQPGEEGFAGVANDSSCEGPGGDLWRSEPDVGRVAHGVPSRVDRLRALGNAVVPQQAYPLFRAIAEIEMNRIAQEGERE